MRLIFTFLSVLPAMLLSAQTSTSTDLSLDSEPGESWALRYSLNGVVNEIPFEERNGQYVIENSKVLNGYGSQNDSDGWGSQTYIQIVNGDNVWGNFSDNVWFNPDNQGEREHVLSTANARTKFDFVSNIKGYDFTLTPSTKMLRITENTSSSTVPETFYVRYNASGSSWTYNVPMTKSANGKRFTSSVSVTGESGDIAFTESASTEWDGTVNYGPKGVSANLPAGIGTYNMEFGNTNCWTLPKGEWSFVCDFTNPAYPIVTFVERGKLYMRYNSFVTTDGGSVSINPETWVYSNPMTSEADKKFSGIISFIKETGGAICFSTYPSAGWTGAYNYGPSGTGHLIVSGDAATEPMRLGSANSWLLGKGTWTFECDLSGTSPTVTFTKVGDGTTEDHDNSTCTAPKVYIVGPVTGHGWVANRAWRMSHVSGDNYTFTVPAGSNWMAGKEFKVRVQPHGNTDPTVDESSTTYYGGVNNIVRNTYTTLTLSNSANAANAAATTRTVPAGAIVDYNTSSRQIMINYDGSEVSDASDSWAINCTYAVPEVYLVGDRLNNWNPNPGYRMVRSGAQTYRLERFVIQRDTRFQVRVYNSPERYIRWGITGKDRTLTGKETNLTFDLTSGQYALKWDNGVAMVSMEFNLESHTLTVIPHPEVPNQADFDSDKQIHGIPYVAFMGTNMKQTQSNNSIYQHKTTGEGWTMSWQAYSINHKRTVLYEDMVVTYPSTSGYNAMAGRAVPNLTWPPRYRIDFGDDSGHTWTTDDITFHPADDFKNKELTAEDAKNLLQANGITLSSLSAENIPGKAIWTRYDTRNLLMAGSFKLWSGWGGQIVNNNCRLATHHNWSIGDSFDSNTTVEPNILYTAYDETEGVRGRNLEFSTTDMPERYFRQFSFYTARYEENGRTRYKYFFAARLAAEDPVITSHRVSGRHDALQCKYRIQQQLSGDGSVYETKKLTSYRLYITENDGKTFNPTPFYTHNFDSPISIKDFNLTDEAGRAQIVRELEPGDYRFKIEVNYEGDNNTYEGTSPVMSIIPQIAADLRVGQITETNTDGKKNWTFDILINGNVPDKFTEVQKANVTGYTLVVASQTGSDFPAGAKLTWTEGSADKSVSLTTSPVTINIVAEEGHNMPEVRMWNARVGRTYRFSLSMTGKDLEEIPAAVLRQSVFGPCAEIAASTEFANNLGKEFRQATPDELRATVNWVKANCQITPPAVATESLERYDVAYTISYNGKSHTVNDASLDEASGGYKNVTVNRLPFNVDEYTTNGCIDYDLAISTVYTEKNAAYSFPTPTEETTTTLSGALFPEPRGATPDDRIILLENYSERFHGLHSYWQDAFVAIELTGLPCADGLVGSLKQETVNGITGVVPIEAGGNYAFGNLLSGPDDVVTALWYQPMPEGVSGHEHYKGMHGLQIEDGHVVAAAFFAGTGEAGHDPRNQWFCTVDHNNEPAAKGFGTLKENEANEFFKDIYKPSGDPNDEMSWYKDGRIYRKVHHVNHETRYFSNSSSYVDHKQWKFALSEYQPIHATIRYQYNMLSSNDVFTVEVPANKADEAPSRTIAAAHLPQGASSKPLTTGATYELPLNGTNVTTNDFGTTAIDTISDDDANAPMEYYNLQGVKVGNPVPGCVYIFRQGSRSGKTLIK